ncbi:putative OsmC-like protein [Algoriphagus iocasae]|uniref:Putative OsmC-like protein n=1 Tax=Algoriphagus iocasae TaxID=1836499 RepID=A0A841ML20_9BACT|nr:OsmC family protein [Algoriphagus iocasae]MBB6324936.1 putative OsmC-like protein [Algoriphagus iocasae]
MSKQEVIKEKFLRTQKALLLKPALGHGTGVSRTKIIDGLSCETQEGEWNFKIDMPTQIGGTATGPVPGVLGRAALGSCLAIGYMIWASKLGVKIDGLEVTIEADYDDGALFDTSDVPPGYSEIRYYVKVTSDASKDAIQLVLDAGDKHSPYLDVFSRAQKCIRKVEIINS